MDSQDRRAAEREVFLEQQEREKEEQHVLREIVVLLRRIAEALEKDRRISAPWHVCP